MFKRALVGAALVMTAAVWHLPDGAAADPPSTIDDLTYYGLHPELGLPQYIDGASNVYTLLTAGEPPLSLNPLVFASTSEAGWGVYYDEVGDKLYLIVEDGIGNIWIIEL